MNYTYFNREEFIRQTADNEDVARQVAELYHRDLDQELSAMDQAFSSGNMEAVRRLAHKAKSGFIIMGATDLYNLAVNLETRCKNGETDLKKDLVRFREMCEGLDGEVVEAFRL